MLKKIFETKQSEPKEKNKNVPEFKPIGNGFEQKNEKSQRRSSLQKTNRNLKKLLIAFGMTGLFLGSFFVKSYFIGDHVSENEKKQWEINFASSQPLKLPVISRQEQDGAIAEMPISPEQKTELKKQLDYGRVRLVWLSFQDVASEDGDQVRVDSGKFSRVVTLMHNVEKVAIPEPPAGVVNVYGLHDGGGGITIAITSNGSPVNLPYMNEGQTVGVPVSTTQP